VFHELRALQTTRSTLAASGKNLLFEGFAFTSSSAPRMNGFALYAAASSECIGDRSHGPDIGDIRRAGNGA